MSVREFSLPGFPQIAGTVFSECCVIAITPAAGDYEWGAGAAWVIARAAAKTGRRTALIDLNLEDPLLHEQASAPQETGIVDAFLFGASLQHVASKDETPNLHFIGVGTPPSDPQEVWGSDRWQRLARGFQKENALLLLFIPPTALGHLPLVPDLLLAVAPTGFGPDGPKSPDVRTMSASGIPLAVVKDGPAPAQQQVEQPSRPSFEFVEDEVATPTTMSAPTRRAGPLRKILLPIVGVLVTAMVTTSVLLMRERDPNSTVEDPAAVVSDEIAVPEVTPQDTVPAGEQVPIADSTADSRVEGGATDSTEAIAAVAATTDSTLPSEEVEQVADSAMETQVSEPEAEVTDTSVSPPPAVPEEEIDDEPALELDPPSTNDTLRYSIQVAAWSHIDAANDHLARFYTAGVPATITIVRDAGAQTWYRVFVGASGTVDAARDLRQRLRQRGLVGSTRGLIIETPYALLLATHSDRESGTEAMTSLREMGVPAYIVTEPEGATQVLVGAFESPEQADLADSLFPEEQRDLSRILVLRVGNAR